MIRRPPRSTPLYSSAASDVYKRQVQKKLPMLKTELAPLEYDVEEISSSDQDSRAEYRLNAERGKQNIRNSSNASQPGHNLQRINHYLQANIKHERNIAETPQDLVKQQDSVMSMQERRTTAADDNETVFQVIIHITVAGREGVADGKIAAWERICGYKGFLFVECRTEAGQDRGLSQHCCMEETFGFCAHY
eukprot:TRINITY_DN7445_c0_g1_i7.p1 TRINITY_DN7445_c0_g1~~TRINITY_DN7445_c0_g1_i7.p1  ORF type:complete len:204 (-),score=16.00 TRINITY_DN7445_c0_g1_i7:144-719(-)